MIANIAEALDTVRKPNSNGIRYSPHGFNREHLNALNLYGRLSDVPWSEGTGMSLFFLADEESEENFLLEGRFVSMDALGFRNRFNTTLAAGLRKIDQSESTPDIGCHGWRVSVLS